MLQEPVRPGRCFTPQKGFSSSDWANSPWPAPTGTRGPRLPFGRWSMANLPRACAWIVLVSILATLPAAAAQPPYSPVIHSADFVNRVDHVYFPLDPGTVWRYVTNMKSGQEVNDVVVSNDIKVILGVMTTVVLDSVYTNGDLTEATVDWYAQDKAGNVWYF